MNCFSDFADSVFTFLRLNIRNISYENIGDASASTSVTVIGGGDVPAYIPIWYDLSVLKPVLLSVLAAVASAIGLYRTRKK